MNRQIGSIILLLVLAAAPCTAAQMTLEQCLEYAIAHSPELQQLKISLQNQQLNTRLEKATFAFKLDGSATHDPEEEDTVASLTLKKKVVGGIDVSLKASVNDDDDDESDNTSLSLSLSKIIIGGGTIRESRLGIDNSLLDELIALNKLNRQRRKVEYKVKQSYYRVIRNLQTLKVRELRLERSKKNLEHAIDREDPLDIATARIEVPENEASVLAARRGIESSLDQLKQWMGLDITGSLHIKDALQFNASPVQADDDIRACFRNHEDILNAELARRKIQNTSLVRQTQQYPTLSLSATSSQSHDGDLRFGGNPEHTVGLSFAWELGRTTDRINYIRTRNNLDTKDLEIHALKLDKTRQIRDLARRLKEALSLIALQEEKITFSKRKSALYADRWENGEVGILEYIRSQNELQNSKIQLINYKTDYMELLSEYQFLTAR